MASKTTTKKSVRSTAKPAAKPASETTRNGAKASAATGSASRQAKAPAKTAGAAKSAPTAKPAAASRAAKSAPRITTGRGPNAAEIGKDLVNLVNQGKADDAVTRWYDATILSVEGDGQSWKGLKALHAKNEWWYANHEPHSLLAEGPYVGATGFAVRYSMSFTPRGKQRIEMTEVGVYTVRDGKIVREEYMYAG